MKIPLFDGHCDTISRCQETGEGLLQNSGQLDLRRTAIFAPYAQFFAFYFDPEEQPERSPWEHFQREYGLFSRQMEKNKGRITLCRTAAQAKCAFAGGRAAAFLAVEGAEMLDCSLEKLECAYDLGVRSVNLTWNHANLLSGSCVEEAERGLSGQGRKFVRRMGELGMLVDVSHLSDAGFWEVAECVPGPFWASHSNSREVFFHPRNLTDRQITAIIDHQGVIGLNLYPKFLGEKPGMQALLRHLEHILSLGGEDAVALGGDWDGMAVITPGFESVESLGTLYETLLRRNYREELVRKLFFNNLMRIVSRVCNI